MVFEKDGKPKYDQIRSRYDYTYKGTQKVAILGPRQSTSSNVLFNSKELSDEWTSGSERHGAEYWLRKMESQNTIRYDQDTIKKPTR
jgi:hypothetical protein